MGDWGWGIGARRLGPPPNPQSPIPNPQYYNWISENFFKSIKKLILVINESSLSENFEIILFERQCSKFYQFIKNKFRNFKFVWKNYK